MYSVVNKINRKINMKLLLEDKASIFTYVTQKGQYYRETRKLRKPCSFEYRYSKISKRDELRNMRHEI